MHKSAFPHACLHACGVGGLARPRASGWGITCFVNKSGRSHGRPRAYAPTPPVLLRFFNGTSPSRIPSRKAPDRDRARSARWRAPTEAITREGGLHPPARRLPTASGTIPSRPLAPNGFWYFPAFTAISSSRSRWDQQRK